MLRIEVLLLGVALCALAVEGGLFSRLTKRENGKSETNQNEDAEDNRKEVCYDLLGCFSLEKPWKYALRPIPAPKSPEEIPVRLLFFTRPNTDEEYVITTYPNVDLGGAPFDANKPTAIITHGFTNNGSSEWMHSLKDAYLSKVDANVMLTDWGPGAQHQNYLQVTGNTRVVGKVVARTLRHLMDNYGLQPSKVHLMGHSLGAQISSYIAKDVPGIARLTALDPAQPAFEGYDKIVRLDKTDAEFVDVIHTDAKPFIPALGFGMVQPHGHVDFYVNGGFEQPGCIVPDNIPKITGLLDLAKFPVEYLSEIKTCNHGRAHQYLIEAFNETDNCIFWGHKATAPQIARTVAHTLTQGLLTKLTALSPTCTKENCVPLGFATKQSPLRGVFVVTTNKDSPYCISEPGIPPEDVPNAADRPKTPLGKAAAFAKHSVGRVGEHIKSIVSFF
ncbi:UNVERIFIED_CONTAM: hypothetical protein PYX00_007103 [Menopon gallinae]|uniref:Lipase domain-containing protein n=1 Tax=Menopon gallinae TaxID=328185 RepID=A0AAW2HHF2_9NEOP